jgi:lipopolysaccharide/colanic/teichoic acid biosynthesis glycosyltransferase
MIMVACAPLVAAAAIAVRATSRGPAFYSQVRLGRNRKRFVIYKLRSMVVDSEAKTGPVWCKPNDPRVTRVGWFLRKSHIDELPQLWNIFNGEMSFFGPRPERPEIAERLAEDLPRYWDRLSVLPGVTGLAQVLLPPDVDQQSVRRKLEVDLVYIANRSTWLHVRLLLGTALLVLGTPPRWIGWMLGLPGRTSARERQALPVASRKHLEVVAS